MNFSKPLVSGVASLAFGAVFIVPAFASPMDDCILETFAANNNSMTIGEIKQVCADKAAVDDEAAIDDEEMVSAGPVEDRLNKDGKNILLPFTLMAHNPNFFMLAYDSSREDISPYGFPGSGTAEFDNAELQFQISIKTPLAINLFDQQIDMYAAYTNRSFWQAFNDKDQHSAFFRETNHEPEAWIQKRHDVELPLGFHYRVTKIGINHQSNGRSGDHDTNPYALSRSWNRIFAEMIFERGNLALRIKPWYRIPEDSDDDDNEDITDYLGHGELRLAYKLNKHTFSLMTRNNIESGFSEGALEASWSFPIFNYPYIKGYLQYFTGYGESLADYNQYNNHIGLGISLSDWL